MSLEPCTADYDDDHDDDVDEVLAAVVAGNGGTSSYSLANSDTMRPLFVD